jgi:hypothetical protein
MLRRVVLFAALVLGLTVPAVAQVRVDGYTKKDGTYVAPHMRSAPDSGFNNNWSTSPNVNPFTGQQGTRAPRIDPYQQPDQPMQPMQPYGTQPRQRW